MAPANVQRWYMHVRTGLDATADRHSVPAPLVSAALFIPVKLQQAVQITLLNSTSTAGPAPATCAQQQKQQQWKASFSKADPHASVCHHRPCHAACLPAHSQGSYMAVQGRGLNI